jgi:hypothetical protein
VGDGKKYINLGEDNFTNQLQKKVNQLGIKEMMRCFHYQRQSLFSPFSLSYKAFSLSILSLFLINDRAFLSPFSLSYSTRLAPKFC